MRAGRAEVVPDTAAVPAAAALAALGIGEFVNLPFVWEGAWLFILSITASEPRDWRPDELALMLSNTHSSTYMLALAAANSLSSPQGNSIYCRLQKNT